ncbi:hypothetical protein SAY86_016794 [Trapa natans]|uniref:non-specific serine/threonine protein kinase n=1 Tax=Trapa natans TaxID=22666 RepID=A0AAN7M3Y9_TRANT|nr:hypothetical protein SAY86_016794 [Trapa natans]
MEINSKTTPHHQHPPTQHQSSLSPQFSLFLQFLLSSVSASSPELSIAPSNFTIPEGVNSLRLPVPAALSRWWLNPRTSSAGSVCWKLCPVFTYCCPQISTNQEFVLTEAIYLKIADASQPLERSLRKFVIKFFLGHKILMGTGEDSTTSKSAKPTSSQEIPITAAYPDWTSSMQAYYGAGATPTPFFASNIASPTPHPYLWGGQHPLISPYGTPVPYSAIYPPGGVYAHPNIAMTPGSAPYNNNEVAAKVADGKEGASKKNKRTPQNAGSAGNKNGDGAKVTSGSGNDCGSHSGETGSDDSSDANEDNNQQDFRASDTVHAAGTNVQASVTGKPINSGPATNLNMGMDLWNSPYAAGTAKMRPAVASSAVAPGTMMSDQWIQDERELKRQRRKQSNRESARRSRLRKQAECEELQAKVETLTNENHNLREEMQRLSEECEKLSSENCSIKEELTRLCGPGAVAALEQNSTANIWFLCLGVSTYAACDMKLFVYGDNLPPRTEYALTKQMPHSEIFGQVLVPETSHLAELKRILESSNPSAPSPSTVVLVSASAAERLELQLHRVFELASHHRNFRRVRGAGPSHNRNLHCLLLLDGQHQHPNWHNGGGQNLPPPSNGACPAPPPSMNSGDMGYYSGQQRLHQPMPPPSPGLSLGFNNNSFTYEELSMATNGFPQERLLGQGGFGYVHKGVLPSGKEVAVKSLKPGSGQGEREFQAEVEIISRVHHRHLLSLVGYCITGSQRMMVYDFVPNNTIRRPWDKQGRPVMEWETRLRIAVGSAKGFAYLHEGGLIIHRDIKIANILLDNNFVAMRSYISMKIVHWTFFFCRYLAPEYAASGKLTEKSNVFSFGVMLLELITGKRRVDNSFIMEDSLVDWAGPLLNRALQEGVYEGFVDDCIEGNYNHQEMARMVSCVSASIRHSARKRPKMNQIVRVLEGDVSLDYLNHGVKPGQSSMFSLSNGSSHNDTSMYNADMKRLRDLTLGSQEFAAANLAVTPPAVLWNQGRWLPTPCLTSSDRCH